MPLDLDIIIKYGPVVCGLISFASLLVVNCIRKKENELMDLFIVGAAGSSVPTGILLIWAAFDKTIIPKLSDASVYIAFAGAALLFIFYRTFKEKVS